MPAAVPFSSATSVPPAEIVSPPVSVSLPGLLPAAMKPPFAIETAPAMLPEPPSVAPEETVTAPVPVIVPLTARVPPLIAVVPV